MFIVTFSACFTVALAARTPQAHQHPAEGGAHHHPQAARLQNPVPVSVASIADRPALYHKQCGGCHGDTGKGDGAMSEALKPTPSNLADADWTHGSTDVFPVIRDGVQSTGMRAFARQMTTAGSR